jgi:hypothetical protein
MRALETPQDTLRWLPVNLLTPLQGNIPGLLCRLPGIQRHRGHLLYEELRILRLYLLIDSFSLDYRGSPGSVTSSHPTSASRTQGAGIEGVVCQVLLWGRFGGSFAKIPESENSARLKSFTVYYGGNPRCQKRKPVTSAICRRCTSLC